MLHLNSRVHFYKIVLSCLINQEFHRTGASVINCLCYFYGIIADGLSLLICQAKSRCELDNFLMSSLDRAVSFIKMNDIALFVSQNLNFYMLWILKIFFNKNIIYAESFSRFTPGASELRQKFFF